MSEVQRSIGLMVAVMAVAVVGVFPTEVMAFTAPAAGDFMYDAYDIGVNKILDGPIGNLVGMGLVAFGVISFMDANRGAKQGLPALIAGGVLPNLDAAVTTLGFMV